MTTLYVGERNCRPSIFHTAHFSGKQNALVPLRPSASTTLRRYTNMLIIVIIIIIIIISQGTLCNRFYGQVGDSVAKPPVFYGDAVFQPPPVSRHPEESRLM